MVWLGMPALFWLINGDIAGTNIALLGVVTLVGGAFASVAGVNIRPLIMNVNEPEMRGMALSLQVLLPRSHLACACAGCLGVTIQPPWYETGTCLVQLEAIARVFVLVNLRYNRLRTRLKLYRFVLDISVSYYMMYQAHICA
jgi:hypothetical protein